MNPLKKSALLEELRAVGTHAYDAMPMSGGLAPHSDRQALYDRATQLLAEPELRTVKPPSWVRCLGLSLLGGPCGCHPERDAPDRTPEP